jgi:nucleotide-binding universal stress UspA family protein
MEFKKMLWATDLSENARQALPYVSSLSEKYQTEVHVMYVLEEMGPFGAWYGDFDQSRFDKLQSMERQKAEETLDEICNTHLDSCPLYVRHTAIGDPASEILKLIDKEKPDVVVLTTRGRKGRFQFGSVAEKIVKHASVPVLTVPANG